MALDLTPEQKATGRKNFDQAVGDLAGLGGPDRRTFMKSVTAAGAVVPLSAAVYFGYDSWKGNKAVRTALIGCGDEGGVLVGDHNPEFNDIVAVCDLRPYNLDRIFEGEAQGPRKGLNKIYGKDAAARIARYDDHRQLLADKGKLGIEAVIIATPLHSHHPITVDCLNAGLHVLCEKLMARNVTLCKDMIRAAKETGRLLSVGHQRHYSMLYAHALEVVNAGVLGDVKHIRALWHRNNSWPLGVTDKERAGFATGNDVDGTPFDIPELKDGWCKPVLKEDAAKFLADPERLKAADYRTVKELVRWRLYDRTGGGLMAELGSHQLDAASIFLGKVHPLAVYGAGGRYFYGDLAAFRAGKPTGPNPRESDDHVFVTYEFPGRNHPLGADRGTDENDVVVVTYTSVNTNSFEEYGECLMGSRGTMVVEREKDVYLFREPEKGGGGGKDTTVKVTAAKGGAAAMEASSTWGAGGAAAGISKGPSGPLWDTPVRGYRSEMEHFAFCVRQWGGDKVSYEKDGDGRLRHADRLPRCHGEVAMADAILALTANMAMDRKVRIPFEAAWFDPDSPAAPEQKYGKGGATA